MSKGAKAAVIVGAVAGGLVLLAGAAVAAFILLSGRGPQPESAMPSDTIAFVRIDFDPSAGQKINALRFLTDNLPDEADYRIDPDSDDPIGDALEAAGVFDDVDFDWADIDSWAGDRVAIAAIPGEAGEAEVAVFVRIDDEEALRSFFVRYAPEASYAMVREGYAVFAESPEVVDSVTGANRWLADDADFRQDMDELGGGQILVAWADVAAAVEAQDALNDLAGTNVAESDVPDVTGSIAMGLSVEPDVLELLTVANGISVDGDSLPWMPPSGDLSSLPSDVVAAASVGNLGQYLEGVLDLDALADQLPEFEDQLAAEYGVSLDDVISVLSTTITAFALESRDGFDEAPLIGVRMRENDDTTEDSVEDLLTAIDGRDSIRVESGEGAGGEAYVELSSVDQSDPFDAADRADEVLGDLEDYRKVLVGEAAMTAFVNMSTLWDYVAAQSPDTETYRDITAAGLAYEQDEEGDDVTRFRLRLAFTSE
jgi:hypothetical protein